MQPTINNSFNKQQFYKNFISIAIPIALQQLISVSSNFIDNIMVGTLGTVAIASVGFANQIFFIYVLCLVGLFSGATTYMAQYFGKKDYANMQKIFSSFTLIMLVVGIIFTIFTLIYANNIIKIFSTDNKVIQNGTTYLFIIGWFFPFFAVSFSISQALRSIGLTKFALYITLVSTLVNTFLNYLLIYGNWGAPRLEVQGAAIATLIARLIEFIGFIAIFYFSKAQFKTNFKNYWWISKSLFLQVLNKTSLVFIQEVFWVMGVTTLIFAFSKAGTDYIAIINIGNVIFEIGVIIFLSIASATSVLIGHQLGANNLYAAKRIGQTMLRLVFFMGLFATGVGFAIIKPVLYLYHLPDYIINTAMGVLSVYATALFFIGFNWIIIVGVLRAGGDNKAALIIDLLPKFLYAIPMAFLTVVYLQWDLWICVIFVMAEELIKIVFALLRFKSYKWLTNLTK